MLGVSRKQFALGKDVVFCVHITLFPIQLICTKPGHICIHSGDFGDQYCILYTSFYDNIVFLCLVLISLSYVRYVFRLGAIRLCRKLLHLS